MRAHDASLRLGRAAAAAVFVLATSLAACSSSDGVGHAVIATREPGGVGIVWSSWEASGGTSRTATVRLRGRHPPDRRQAGRPDQRRTRPKQTLKPTPSSNRSSASNS